MLRKILKDKRGMTLLEVLVAFTISLIILGAAFALIVPSLKNFSYNSKLADAKNTSALIVSNIQNKVQFAKSVEIKDGTYSPSGTGTGVIYQQADLANPNVIKLMLKSKTSTTGNDLLSSAFFDELKYDIKYTVATGNTSGLEVKIVVTQIGRTNPIYTTTSTIPILNKRGGKGSFVNSVPEVIPGTQVPGTYLVFK